jgi:hypothetical protein
MPPIQTPEPGQEQPQASSKAAQFVRQMGQAKQSEFQNSLKKEPAPQNQNPNLDFKQVDQADQGPAHVTPSVNQPYPAALKSALTEAPILTQPTQPTPQHTPQTANPEPNLRQEILEELKQKRDQLRYPQKEEGERSLISRLQKPAIFASLILILSLSLIFGLAKSPPEPIAQKQAYVSPSNLESKPVEEQAALNILKLARANKPQEIISKWLDPAKLDGSTQDFKNLVSAYASSADGQSSEIIEKKVGKVDFIEGKSTEVPTENPTGFTASSLILSSNRFNYQQKVYLKLNVYQPDPAQQKWQLYALEFSSDPDQSRKLQASL